jgi:hypothetical protein
LFPILFSGINIQKTLKRIKGKRNNRNDQNSMNNEEQLLVENVGEW